MFNGNTFFFRVSISHAERGRERQNTLERGVKCEGAGTTESGRDKETDAVFDITDICLSARQTELGILCLIWQPSFRVCFSHP